MSLLDTDDFIFLKEHSIATSPEGRPNPPPPLEAKGRVKSGELTFDAQKLSSFSLRRKKEDDKRTHKKNKSLGKIQPPPDSPKAKSGPSPNFKSSRKQYAHLLENELSSDGEEDDNSESFVLSKGRQARQKRGSVKLSSGGEGSLEPPTIDNTSPIKTITPPNAPSFPVSFTPPHKPDVTPDLIPPIPPPPQGHTYQATQSQPFITQTTPTFNEPEWSITDEMYEKCNEQFKGLQPFNGLLTGDKARDFFLKSKLPLSELSKIWKLSDIDGDGSLTLQEFIVAMKLVLIRRQGYDIPVLLPDQLNNLTHYKQVSVPVSLPLFNFPPPPSKGAQFTSPSELSSPPIPSFPRLLVSAKTDPIIGISDVQTDHVTTGHVTNDHVTTAENNQITEGGIADLLGTSFMSEGDVPLLSDNTLDLSFTDKLNISQLALIKGAGLGVESTDEDDTCNLVTSGGHPVAKPRKKRRVPNTDIQRSRTIHGPHTGAPPPIPPPYKKTSVSPSPEDVPPSIDSPDTDNDLLLIISKPVVPPKPDRKSLEILVKDSDSDKGHGRSTSWDLTKMLRDEGDLRFHDDVPSAEPPKLPPRIRKDEGGYHSDDDDDGLHGRRMNKVATPLQRSASTGSLASIGVPSTSLPNKSRTSSIESGALLVDTGYHGDDSLLRRTNTMTRRPAPAPPPNKPNKKPIYPPSFKKIIVDSPSHLERSLSGDQSNEDSLLNSIEIYQKKSKSELQKSIKRLKEENNMYNGLNNELNEKLNELKQERYRLEVRLNQLKPV